MKNSIQLGLAGLAFMAFFGLSLNQHLKACSLTCANGKFSQISVSVYSCAPGKKCKEISYQGEPGLKCGKYLGSSKYNCSTLQNQKGNA
ncbi:MAG: hypothetical protein AAFP92_31530 [Bacteroidota bacterium]